MFDDPSVCFAANVSHGTILRMQNYVLRHTLCGEASAIRLSVLSQKLVIIERFA